VVAVDPDTEIRLLHSDVEYLAGRVQKLERQTAELDRELQALREDFARRLALVDGRLGVRTG
jgi:chaperonin cofactor prefoldin